MVVLASNQSGSNDEAKKIAAALKEITQESNRVQQALKKVERGLKLDAGNVDLIKQKMELLQQSSEIAGQKLNTLQETQSRVEAQLRRYSAQLNSSTKEQEKLAQATKELSTFFEATETDVSSFADVLGTRLTNAIRNGTASTDEINKALKLMGRNTLGASANIDEMRNALRSAGEGASLDQVKKDLEGISKKAGDASNALNDFAQKQAGSLTSNVTSVVTQALDVSSLNTKIDIMFDVPEESVATIRDSVTTVTTYIGDQETALEGVRKQWALNKDQSDEANASIIQGAGAIANVYGQIDFAELVQEVNDVGAALGISNEEALGLIDSLLKSGFPPEQLDTIASYGQQMKEVGFTTNEIQAVFEKGIDLKNFDVSKLNDGIKTANNNMKSFGQEVPNSLAKLLEGTDVSLKQFQAWGQAVAKGGEDGASAMGEVSSWLQTIEDDSLKNSLAMEIFGTETGLQVNDMISVFQGLANAQDQTAENMQGVTDTINGVNADPLMRIADAGKQIKDSLQPVFEVIADFVGKIAEWVSNNASLVAAITAIAMTISILVGAFATLMPAIAGLVTAWPALAAAVGAILSPVGLVIAAIAGIGIALVAAYQNSETFRENVQNVFNQIKEVAVIVFEAVASFIGEKIALIKQFWDENGTQIMQAVENVFNTIKGVIDFVMPAIQFVIETVWTAIQNVINGALDIIMGAVKIFSGLFTGDFSAMWEGIKQLFSGAIELIIGWTTLTFFGGIKKIFTELAQAGISLLKGMWDNIASFFSTMGTTVSTTVSNFSLSIVNFFKGLGTNVINTVKNLWNNVVTSFSSLSTSVKETISTMASSVWQFVKDLSTNFFNTISTMKTNVINKMTEIKDGMLERITVLPEKFIEIGKNIIEGLIRGISNMAVNAIESITGVVDGVINKAKSLLGIKSPSRVFAAIGADTVRGMEIGMSERQQQLNQVMTDLTKGLEQVSIDFRKNEKKIAQDANTEIEAIEQKAADDIEKIRQTAASKKRALTVDEANAIVQIKEQSEQKVNAIEAKALQDRALLHADSDKERLEAIKQFISEKKVLDQLNLLQEAEVWRKSANLFKDGTKEKIEAQKAYQSTVQAIAEAADDELLMLDAFGENAGKGLLKSLSDTAPAIAQKAAEIAQSIKQALDLGSTSLYSKGFEVELNERLVGGIKHSSLKLQDTMNTVYGSLASSTQKSKANHIAQTQIIQRGANIDLASLVEAITQLAGRPVQTIVAMDGKEVANAVSTHQYSNANLSALTKGVVL